LLDIRTDSKLKGFKISGKAQERLTGDLTLTLLPMQVLLLMT
jgi:hypothetical protein